MLSELKPFASHLTGRRRPLTAVLALGLAGAAVSLSTPLLGKAFIDAVSARRDFGIVPIIAGTLVLLSLLDLWLATLARRVHARLSADLLAALRAALFERCTRGPLAPLEALRHGDLLTRFGTDLPRVQSLLVDGVLGAVQNVLFLLVAAVITLSLSPSLTAWSFLGLGLALAATAAFRRPIEQHSGQLRAAMADLAHLFAERLAALRAIRLHHTADEERHRLAEANARLNREVVSFQVLDALSAGVPGLLLTLALAWIYLWGGRLIEAGTISLGTFVAFVLYQGRLFAPAQGLLGLVRGLQQARVSIARVVEVIGPGAPAAPTLAPDTAAADRGRVVVDGASFAYPGKAPVFERLCLVVEPGERVGLFGPSGAGKSTLVQLLFGLREPDAGSVRVEGRAATAVTDPAAIGYAGAEPFLLHATVEENLRYGNPGASRGDLERAAALAEAGGFIAALPEGYATVIGGRGLALSDGQRQRLGLARLCLRRPRILVLDEAFSALDLETEARIRRNLREAFAGHTLIVISHRPVGLADLDRRYYLAGGVLAGIDAEALERRLAHD